MHKLGVIAAMAALFATPAMAQGRGRGNNGVPPGQRPPAGMCRIWIDGVPPGQQPAATDCATAAATRPANARIIYGDRTAPQNRRIFNSGGDVVIMNGQKCVRRTDRNGQVRTVCADDDRDDDDRRLESRVDDEHHRRVNGASTIDHGKIKKHKGKDHDDRGRDRN